MGKRNQTINTGMGLMPEEKVLDEPQISPLCLWKDAGLLLLSAILVCLCFNLDALGGLFSLFGLGDIFAEMTEYFQSQVIDVINAAFGLSLPQNPYIMGAIAWMLFQCFKLLFAALSWEKSRVCLTNFRLIYRTGVFIRKIWEIRCAQVESVSLSESLPERVIGAGTLEVRGTGTGEVEIPFLKDAARFKEILHDAVAAARRKA